MVQDESAASDPQPIGTPGSLGAVGARSARDVHRPRAQAVASVGERAEPRVPRTPSPTDRASEPPMHGVPWGRGTVLGHRSARSGASNAHCAPCLAYGAIGIDSAHLVVTTVVTRQYRHGAEPTGTPAEPGCSARTGISRRPTR